MNELYFRQSGNPVHETILFLHGGGISSRMWARELATLREFHCIAPDLPGHGGSVDVAPFTLEESLAGLAQLIDQHCPGKPVSLVAISVGAVVALGLAAEHPEKIKRLLLSGPTPDFGRMAALSFNLLARPLLALMPLSRRTALVARSLNLTLEQTARFAEDLNQIDIALVSRINAVVANQPDVGDSTIPTWITVGEKEINAVKKRAAALVEAMNDAQGFVVGGVGHGWSLEAPELLDQTIRAWMSDAPPPERLESFI